MTREDDRGRSKKTRSVTFRIDLEIIDQLQRDADQKEMSLNVLVNQVLKRYAGWGRYETKMNLMPVPKLMLTSLVGEAVAVAKSNGLKDIDTYRDEIVKQAAAKAFDIMKDTVMFMKKQYNLWAVLSLLEEYMSVSGIVADHKIEGRKHIFVIHHDLGENWSLFTKELLSLIFEKLANVKIETNITPNTTIAQVIL